MARQPIAQFPLDGGMDQRTHRRMVQPPATLDAVNVRYPEVGGVERRPGCGLVANSFQGSDLIPGRGKLFSIGNELLATDGYTIGTLVGDTFLAKDKVPEAVPSMRPVTSPIHPIEQHDVTLSLTGVIFTAWTTRQAVGTVTLFISATKADSGAEILRPTVVEYFEHYHVRLLAVEGAVFLLYTTETTSDISYVKYDGDSAAVIASGVLINDNAVESETDGSFDAMTVGTSFYVAYRDTGGLTKFKKYDVAPSLTASITSTQTAANTFVYGLGTPAGNLLWAVYAYADGMANTVTWRTTAIDTSTDLESVAPFDIATEPADAGDISGSAVCSVDSTTAIAILGMKVTDTGRASIRCPVFSSAGAIVENAAADNRATYWTSLASRPFVVSASPLRVYAWVYTGGAAFDAPNIPLQQPLQYTYMLVDIGADDTASLNKQVRPICWEANRFALSSLRAATNVISVGSVRSSIAKVTRSGGGRMGLNFVSADFASARQFLSAELGGSLYMVPGWQWDRDKLSEIGFAYWPQHISEPSFDPGGGLVAGTTYRWRVCFEFVDENGMLQRSEPSDFAEAVVPPDNSSATFNVANLCVTAKSKFVPTGTTDIGQENLPYIQIGIYRTLDTSVDPNTYYRITADGDTIFSNTFSEYQTFTDITSDADLATRPTLYTGGGVRPNAMPRGFTAIVTYRNRLWIAYGNTIGYSKAFVTGESVSFVDGFELPLEESGDITALWVQDDTLYISTERRIYFLAADGPNDTGALNDIATPNRVATDLGVLDPRSVVVTPMGTVYQSAVGIQLLDRGRSVSPEPFGSRVQDEVESFPEFTSALVHPTGSYITITCKNNDDLGGRLAFDYTSNKWSRDEVLVAAGQPAIISAVNHRGTQHFLTALGSVYAELSDHCFDDGEWFEMRVDTAWFKAAGLQGYQQIAKYTLQCEKLEDADLRIQNFVDYVETPVDDETWSADAGEKPISAMTIPQFETTPSVERVQAMRWRVSDAAPTGGDSDAGDGHGLSPIGLAIELDALSEIFRMPAGQKG